MSCKKCFSKGDYNTPKSLKWIVWQIVFGVFMSEYFITEYLKNPNPTFTDSFGVLVMCFYWAATLYALYRDNICVRYVYRWLDPVTGKEHQHLRTSLQNDYEATLSLPTIAIRQKVSGWRGTSALIIPDGYESLNVAGWSLDKSSTLKEIVLVDCNGTKLPTASLDMALWTITHDWSVRTLLMRSRSDDNGLESPLVHN